VPSVADILRRHGEQYLEWYGSAVPIQHRRASALLAACQSGDLGHVEWHCERCGRSHRTARSCGNRHCPGCQSSKNERWLAEQSARLLDVPYFLVTFTVPEKLRRFVRSHLRACPQRSFAPPPALSKIYRAKFRDEMRRAGIFDAIDSGVWEETFVTDSRAVGGENTAAREAIATTPRALDASSITAPKAIT
jgi:hypothetical protein